MRRSSSLYVIRIMCLLFCWQNFQQAAASDTTQYSWEHLPVIAQPVFPADSFFVEDFGGVADGIDLNTKAINNAINTCNQQGGGVVVLTKGIWLTGPVELKSNVNLHLQKEAILLFTDNFDEYKLVVGTYEGRRSARNQSPISGINLENIAITGPGIIDGNGDAWRMVGQSYLNEFEWKRKLASGGVVSADGQTWFPSVKTKLAFDNKRSPVISEGQSLDSFNDIKDYLRPNLLVLTNCKKILLENVSFQNSPAWCLHPLMCEDLTMKYVTVSNPDYAQNGDGIDVESCRNVLIENCRFDVGDDGICVKSGKDEEGRKRGIPTENMIVRYNTVYKAHGGFVIGSEMSGGARNIFVYDCTFIGTDNGLRFKTTRGRGGLVENIFVKNILMKDILHDAILFDMYYFTRPDPEQAIPVADKTTPQFKNFFISNIICHGAERGIFIRGLPEMPIEQVEFDDITIQSDMAVEIIEGSHITFNNLKLVNNSKSPVLYIENSTMIALDEINYHPITRPLLSLNGQRTKGVSIRNMPLVKEAGKCSFNKGASQDALTILSD